MIARRRAIAARYALLAVLTLLLPACTGSTQTIGQRLGPTQLAPVQVEAWTYEGSPAYRLVTPHYVLFTTIEDRVFAGRIAQVMEGGYEQYQQFLPARVTERPRMECYIFATRNQWADFTRRNTGVFASTYLQINRGGYTLRDWFVAFDIGEQRTYSVAAHEGWHQYAYRNFTGRLPPFLEEGIACMFEDLKLKDGLPQFNLSVNRMRVQALRHAIDERQLIPLEILATLHAGEIVSRSGSTIETFYAENWAFARFLWEGEHARFRPALLRLIADTANGTVVDPTGSHQRSGAPWNAASVAPMLELYLGMSMRELATHYEAFVRRIAFEELEEQFAS